MPDFADRKAPPASAKPEQKAAEPAAKPKAIGSIAAGRPSKEQRETAREAFARLNYNLQSGFKKLEDKLGMQPAKPKDFSNAQNIYNYEYNTNAYTNVEKKEAPKVTKPEVSVVRAPVIGAIAGGLPARTSRVPSGTPTGVAPVADQRAHMNFARGNAPKVEADATRMAKVVEAADQMKKGGLPESPKVKEWASAIRSGKQREVADLNPKAVRGAVEHAAGGSQAAQKLNTPKVAQIESEHQVRSQVLQKGLETHQKAQERAHDFPVGGRPMTAPQQNQMQEHKLTHMMRHNDSAHDTAAVAALESAPARPAEVKSLDRMTTPKIGAMSSMPTASRAGDSKAPEHKKSPWGEGRELRSIEELMRTLITKVERVG